jgi:UDP-2-acetamido-3-amino-2,3-dideoxy-glucuronate N-acetyltransferase
MSPKPSPRGPVNDAPHRLIRDVEFADEVVVYSFTNLYGCAIGRGTRIGPFVEIQKGVRIGAECKVQSHSFICEGVTIGDGVFVGHGVVFVNDKRPKATAKDWELRPVVVEAEASIGSGAVILGGVKVGARAMVGAGAVVTKDIPPDTTVIGSPARPIRML